MARFESEIDGAALTFMVGLLLLAFSMPSRAQAPELIYLRFNEGTGTATADFASPGIGTAATLSDSASWDSANSYLGASSFRPQAPGTSRVDLNSFWTTPGDDYTFEFALRPDSQSSSRRHVIGQAGTGGLRIYLDAAEYGRSRLSMAANGGLLAVQPRIHHGVWTFVSLVFDDTNGAIRVYFDGELVQTFTYLPGPLALTATGPWTIGTSPTLMSQGMQGAIDEFRLWNSARSGEQIRLLAHEEVTSFDLGIGRLQTPVPLTTVGSFYGSGETIRVGVLNVGTSTWTPGMPATVTLEVDGVTIVVDPLLVGTGIAAGAGVVHTFSLPVDLSGIQPHRIRAIVNSANDTAPGNDATEFDLVGGGPGVVHEQGWREDFDAVAPGSPLLPPGWNVSGGAVFQGFGSPIIAALGITVQPLKTHGNFIIAIGGFGSIGSMASPILDLSEMTSPALEYWFINRVPAGSASFPMSTATVEVRDASVPGSPWIPVDTLNGYYGWVRKTVSLSAWAGQAVQVRFRANIVNSYPAFDEIRLVDTALDEGGQVPRPGLAMLDLASSSWPGALNSTLQPVAAGTGSGASLAGPYRAFAVPGGSITIGVEGAAYQPILLVGGRLNPGAATFGIIGQLDIGGVPDPASGIPVNLFNLADGFNPTRPHDQYLYIGPAGIVTLYSAAPMSVLGEEFSIQALVGNPVFPYILISNAIHLTLY